MWIYRTAANHEFKTKVRNSSNLSQFILNTYYSIRSEGSRMDMIEIGVTLNARLRDVKLTGTIGKGHIVDTSQWSLCCIVVRLVRCRRFNNLIGAVFHAKFEKDIFQWWKSVILKQILRRILCQQSTGSHHSNLKFERARCNFAQSHATKKRNHTKI